MNYFPRIDMGFGAFVVFVKPNNEVWSKKDAKDKKGISDDVANSDRASRR